jgi:signal peptidase I
MIPKFNRETYGYNTRQVDEFIDKLHADNQELSRVNDELLLLYLAELREVKLKNVVIPEQSTAESELSMHKLNNLIEQAYSHRDKQPFLPPRAESAPAAPPKKRPRRRSGLPAVILCLALLAFSIVVSLFGTGDSTDPPVDILGFSAMTVISRSMQDYIPQNSLILTRNVDPDTINVGDDITYLTELGTTITHRVVYIYENYQGTGEPGFQTQGTNNARPDPEIVYARQLVGMVIFHNLFLGNVVIFIRSYAMFIGIFVVLTIGLIAIARRLIFGGE